MEHRPIRLVLSDVDGTLLTSDKQLTGASVAAVQRLHEAGIRFTITSSRPPQGLASLVNRLAVDAPIGAFNGGAFVDAAMTVLERHALDTDVVEALIVALDAAGVDVWGYTATHWFVRDPDAWHVAHEARVVEFAPSVAADLAAAMADHGGAVKVLGVSQDHERIAATQKAVDAAYGARVSATCSQAYYLDITHPAANKGTVVEYLAATVGVPTTAIATIGDGENDTLMFARSGMSFAMGNATDVVKARAGRTTATNDEDGFARAIDEVVVAQGA